MRSCLQTSERRIRVPLVSIRIKQETEDVRRDVLPLRRDVRLDVQRDVHLVLLCQIRYAVQEVREPEQDVPVPDGPVEVDSADIVAAWVDAPHAVDVFLVNWVVSAVPVLAVTVLRRRLLFSAVRLVAVALRPMLRLADLLLVWVSAHGSPFVNKFSSMSVRIAANGVTPIPPPIMINLSKV